jgi:hypothetical protein
VVTLWIDPEVVAEGDDRQPHPQRQPEQPPRPPCARPRGQMRATGLPRVAGCRVR